MKTEIISQDNQRVIRITKSELAKVGISDNLEIISEGNYIVVRQSNTPRIGWDNAFKTMRECRDDKLILEFDH